jgi:hypothetical protein
MRSLVNTVVDFPSSRFGSEVKNLSDGFAMRVLQGMSNHAGKCRLEGTMITLRR